jgi:hypothetical protein
MEVVIKKKKKGVQYFTQDTENAHCFIQPYR